MDNLKGMTANHPAVLVKRMVELYTAARSVFAEDDRLTVTLAWPPAAIEPFVAETVSQAEVLIRLHFSEPLLKLDTIKICELGVNGPPTGPVAVKPLVGVNDIG